MTGRTGTGRAAAPADGLAIEVLNAAGRAVPVEFTVRRGTVEVWAARRCCGILDRRALRDWLADPAGPHGAGDVSWTASPGGLHDGSHDGVGLTVAGAFPRWELAPRDLRRLRELV